MKEQRGHNEQQTALHQNEEEKEAIKQRETGKIVDKVVVIQARKHTLCCQ